MTNLIILLAGTLGYIAIAIGLHELFAWYIRKDLKNDTSV